MSTHTDSINEWKKEGENALAEEDLQEAVAQKLAKEVLPKCTNWKLKVGNEWKCLICNKWATPEHLHSMEHVKRMEEHAYGTWAIGEGTSMRRFAGDKCTGVLTKAKIKEFLGDAVEHLVMAARIIHKRKEVIYAEARGIGYFHMKYSTNWES